MARQDRNGHEKRIALSQNLQKQGNSKQPHTNKQSNRATMDSPIVLHPENFAEGEEEENKEDNTMMMKVPAVKPMAQMGQKGLAKFFCEAVPVADFGGIE